MLNKLTKFLMLIAISAISTGANAHAGHHEHSFFNAIQHMLTSPFHLLGIAAAVGVGVWLFRRQKAQIDE